MVHHSVKGIIADLTSDCESAKCLCSKTFLARLCEQAERYDGMTSSSNGT